MIVGIVVFFPALVNITFGLRSAPTVANDLLNTYGASKFTTLRKVALPAALPALFTSIRISIPGAVTGALLSEWLASGRGVGDEILKSIARFDYSAMWALIFVTVALTVLTYTIAGLMEAVVLRRFFGSA